MREQAVPYEKVAMYAALSVGLVLAVAAHSYSQNTVLANNESSSPVHVNDQEAVALDLQNKVEKSESTLVASPSKPFAPIKPRVTPSSSRDSTGSNESQSSQSNVDTSDNVQEKNKVVITEGSSESSRTRLKIESESKTKTKINGERSETGDGSSSFTIEIKESTSSD